MMASLTALTSIDSWPPVIMSTGVISRLTTCVTALEVAIERSISSSLALILALSSDSFCWGGAIWRLRDRAPEVPAPSRTRLGDLGVVGDGFSGVGQHLGLSFGGVAVGDVLAAGL